MIRKLVPLALVLALLAAFGIQGALAAPAGAPTGVTGIALSGSAQIAWQPVSGADNYVVLRGTSSTNITTTVTPAGGTTGTSFTNTGLTNTTTYYYVVRAVGAGVTSPDSTIAQITPRASSCSGSNGIVTENCFPGTTGWKATNVDDAIDGIEGYATASSITAGDSVGIKVNSAAGVSYRMEIYRSGSYGGSQGRLISTIPNLTAVAQPACDSQSNTGLLDCSNWSTSATLTTTSSWKTGVYLIRLVRSNGTDYHVLITVRNDTANADVLYVVPDTTYQAYNNYGGKSLYSWSSNGANTLSGADRAVKVSYDRPYNQVRTQEHDWYVQSDLRMVSWIESQGYNVGYITATDLDRDPSLLSGRAAVILGGHDEYYSTTMRNALTAARNSGTSLFFSGANSVYWQIRFEASPTSGATRRVQVAYKTIESGPSDPLGPTSTWRDPNGANQPENGLVGIMYLGDSDFTSFPLRVSAAEGQDPLWRHTDLSDLAAGTSQNVGTGLVGWEWDGRVNNGSQPAGLTVLASSPVTGNLSQGNGASTSPGSTVVNVTKYTAASGALVFATGTNYWNRGLDRNGNGDGEPNLNIQQATTNVLSDMGVLPASPDPEIVLDANSPPRVILTSPGDASTGVDVDASPVAVFSRTMNAATITSSTVSLRTQAGAVVPSTITYNAATRRVTIDPTASLALQTTYVARITTGAQATDGTPLTAQAQWTFTTADPPPPPTVTTTFPAGNATGVNPSAAVTATFSRAMAPATITASSFRLTGPGGGAVAATVSYDATAQRATLTPTSPLALNTAYTASLTTAVTAADGTALAAGVSFGFSTWAQPPPAPTVTQTTPAADATGVEVASAISATFSRDMDASTITTQTVSLSGPGGQDVPATVTYDAATRRAILTPTAPLAVSTAYTAAFGTGIRAADGIALASAVTAGFTTSASPCPCQLFPDAVVPDLASNPVQDGRGGAGPFSYELGVKITVTTSAEIRAVRFYKSPGETGTHVGRIWTSGGTQRTTVTFANESASGWQTQQLASPLPITAGQTYVVSVNRNDFYPLTTSGLTNQIVAGPIRSVVGANGVYGNSSGTFPTNSWNDSNYFTDVVVGGDDAPPPTTPPTVTDTTPAAGATDVASEVSPTATFSRAMDPATVNGTSVTLRPQAGGSPVSATVTYDAGTNQVTIDPTADLNASTVYTAQISTAATSANGIALASPATWNFTTSAGPAPGAVVQLFPDTAVPSSLANPVQDGRSGAGPFSYEMGVKVAATVAAEVRAVRFYKSPGETGTHVGRIWTSGGTSLGTVTFTNETASGWQTQQLASPVAITAGQTYVVSVNRNDFYAVTTGGLASQITAGPVRSVVGSNGVYGNTAGTFPTASWNNSNYFTDLQVAATEIQANTPPTVSVTTPANNAVNVATDVSPSATFSRPMDAGTLTSATATVRPEGGSPVAATVTYDSNTNRVTIDPTTDLTPNLDYSVRITTDASSADGVALASPVIWSFTTSAASAASASQLYPDTTTPAAAANSVQDGRTGTGPFTYETGVKVQATLGAEIRAVRFYKSPGETGTHVGRIWSEGGTQLAQVTFTGETTSGWQTEQLATPLAITAGDTYVISVNSNDFYPVTPAGLATQITAGPVRTIVGTNGVFGDSAGTFPTTSWNNSSYLVNLVVAPTEVPPPASAPTVTGTTPADDAGNVAVGASPTATFSRAMDPATLTNATVTIRPDGGSPLAATVTYDPNTDNLTIDPTADLSPGQGYTAQISTAAKSADGVALADPVNWSFTTESAVTTFQLFPNTATPQADGNPVADGRTGTGPFTYEMGVKVTATAPTQIRAIRFFKSSGETGTHVGRVWSSGGTQLAEVTFVGEGSSGWQTAQLASPLALTTGDTYVISVNRNDFYPLTTGGLASQIVAGPVSTVVGGNGVFSDSAGSFPTASYADSDYLVDLVVAEPTATPPPPVPTVGTTTPADNATGVAPDVSPTATFSAAMDPATLTGASVTLRPNGGSPVAATVSYDGSTRRVIINPTNDLTPAQAYTAQISTAATSSRGAALASTVSWSFTTADAPTVTATTPADNATGVAVAVSPTATFSRAMNVASLTSGAATVRPQGGSPVAAGITYDSANNRVIINPTSDLATGTTYTAQISTAASAADGAALAAPVSWSFTTLPAPTVTANTPADGATGVPLAVSPTATFSRAMTVGSLTAASATVTPQGGSAVPATVTYDATNRRVTIDPTADLAAGTDYTVRISTAATATDGAPLASAFTWSFTTITAPTVTATTPADNATGVAFTTSPTATFSRAMDAATITTATATVRPQGGSAMAAAVTYDAANNRVTINPTANFTPGVVYVAQISTGAASADGVNLTSAATWTFTAQPAPTVTATTPAAGATGVAANVSPTATFSRAMNAATLTTSTATVRPQAGGSAVSAVVSYDAANNRVTINPNSNLNLGTAYTATISTGATAADGIPLGSAFTWNFTTIAAPTVTETAPASNATGVAANGVITATFSRAMNPATLTTTSVSVRRQGTSTALAAAVSYDAANNRVTLDPTATFLASTVYTVQITTTATSADGIALASTVSWSFTTIAAPTVTAVTPAANTAGVALDVSPTATFSRAMTPGSLTTTSANVRVKGAGSALTAAVTYDAPTNTVTIDPTANLLPGTAYTAQITTAATAADGLALASTLSWNFSTPAQLFADTLLPTTPATATTTIKETGVRLSVTAASQVRAIRFYKSPGETGTHTGRIWNNFGQQVGSITFTNETASGWQTAQLASPVSLTSGRTYTISVNRNNFYPSTANGLNSQVIAGPVRTVVGTNGVYATTAGTRPTTANGNNNYFVDLIVAPTP